MKINVNDVVEFTKYTDSGKWRCNGTGKVMAIDPGVRVLISVHEHPLYKTGELIQIYPWHIAQRFTPDVIIKTVKTKEEK